MPDATVKIENNTGKVDFGPCPTCKKGQRLIRKNHATGLYQCENKRHEVEISDGLD